MFSVIDCNVSRLLECQDWLSDRQSDKRTTRHLLHNPRILFGCLKLKPFVFLQVHNFLLKLWDKALVLVCCTTHNHNDPSEATFCCCELTHQATFRGYHTQVSALQQPGVYLVFLPCVMEAMNIQTQQPASTQVSQSRRIASEATSLLRKQRHKVIFYPSCGHKD